MGELTDEDKKNLERLMRDQPRPKLVPPDEADEQDVLNPDKFGAPIGMDDEGNLFDPKDRRRSSSDEDEEARE